MHLVTVSTTLEFPIDAVWALVGDFGNLKAWSRAVIDCTAEGEGVGAHRSIATAGGIVRERLDAWDPVAKRLTYTPVSGSSLPVRGLQATISLFAQSDAETLIEWRIDGEPIEAAGDVVELLRKRYSARLEELRSVLARS